MKLKLLTALCLLTFGCQTSKEPTTNFAVDLTKGLVPKADCKPILNGVGSNDTYTAICTLPDESVLFTGYDLTHPLELQAKVFKPSPNAPRQPQPQTAPSQPSTPPDAGVGSAAPTAKKK